MKKNYKFVQIQNYDKVVNFCCYSDERPYSDRWVTLENVIIEEIDGQLIVTGTEYHYKEILDTFFYDLGPEFYTPGIKICSESMRTKSRKEGWYNQLVDVIFNKPEEQYIGRAIYPVVVKPYEFITNKIYTIQTYGKY